MIDLARIRTHGRGSVRFFSERFGGRPYDNCMIDSFMGVLAWLGFNVQDGDDDLIRTYTGVPDPKGMGFNDIRRAATVMFPDGGWTVGVADWDFILANIKRYGRRGRYKAQFSIALDMSKMPDEYRKWCGLSYKGGHAVQVISRNDAGDQFYVYDVMEPTDPPAGVNPDEWVPGAWYPKDVLDAAVLKRNGLIEVSYGYRSGYAGAIYGQGDTTDG